MALGSHDDRCRRVRELLPEIGEISDSAVAAAVVEIWADTWAESKWQRLEDIPKNPTTVDARFGLISHTRSVTHQAIAIARALQEHHGLEIVSDWVVAGALLHDVSKLLEFDPGGTSGTISPIGRLIQHGAYAVHKALDRRLPLELVHVIGSHTIQSRLSPRTLEAIIVHYADYSDTDALLFVSGKTLFLERQR